MSFVSDFINDPKVFMERNIVSPQFIDGGYKGDSGELIITIKRWENRTCSKSGGGVFHLSKKTDGLGANKKMRVYWLGYEHKGKMGGVLDNTFEYMFTVLMNGCSLGIGSQNGDGACRVVHANRADLGAGGRAAQRDGQRVQIGELIPAGASAIEPDSYQLTSHGASTFQATNFARNVNGSWRFFTHRFMNPNEKSTKGVMIHGGVVPATPIPVV